MDGRAGKAMRWWLTAALFLALGLATSVAVAWGATAWHDLFVNTEAMQWATWHRTPGVIVRSTAAGRREDAADGLGWVTHPEIEVPRWSRLRDTPPSKEHRLFELAAGWPLYCLTYSNTGTEAYEHALGRRYRGAIVGLIERPLGAMRTRRLEFLPRQPIWSSLLGDVAFWALAWFIAFNLANVWRINLGLRRRLKNRCPACGYDQAMLTSRRCPECGHERETVFGFVRAPVRWPALLVLMVIVLGEVVVIERFTAGRGIEPIHRAAYLGDLDSVRRELARGVDVDMAVMDRHHGAGNTSLILAAMNGQEDVVEYLLEEGADATLISNTGNALTAAIRANDLALARRLLEAGAPISVQTGDWREPLVMAIREGHVEMLQTLIDAGADVDMRDRFGSSLVDWVVHVRMDRDTRIEMLARLLDAGADPNRPANVARFRSALAEVVRRNDLELARMLLQAGAEADFSAVMAAVDPPHTEALALLIEHGADLSAIHPRTGLSLLGYATPDAREGPPVWEMLVEGGANVNSVSRMNGSSILISAAELGAYTFVEFLLEHGADADYANAEGETASDVALTDEIRALIEPYRTRDAEPMTEPEGSDPP